MVKPKISELLFAAANGAEPYGPQAQMVAQQNGYFPNMSSTDYEAARQTARILRAIATVFKAHEDAEEEPPHD